MYLFNTPTEIEVRVFEVEGLESLGPIELSAIEGFFVL